MHLKTYSSYATLGKAFKLSGQTIQKLKEKMIIGLSFKFKINFINFIKKEEQIKLGINLIEYPQVGIILDCTVQEVPRYGSQFTDSKIFFSEKHKIYCVKKEMAHLPDGRACFVSNFYPGSKHDFFIFLNNVKTYKEFLKKDSDEKECWSIMADKGYEGANKYISSVLPKKGTNISDFQRRENRRIGANRVIVENFYGRMKILWGASRLKVKNDLSLYNATIDICVALINYHILLKPLRANEYSYNNHSFNNSTNSSANNENGTLIFLDDD